MTTLEMINHYLEQGNKDLRVSEIKVYLTQLLEADKEDLSRIKVVIYTEMQRTTNDLKTK